MTIYRITNGDQVEHVGSLDGYTIGEGEGEWTVEAELDRAPTEFEMVVDGEIVVDEEACNTALLAQIDTEAEEIRRRFITPGDGQAMEYLEAVAQARAYIADEAGPFPMLQADVDAGTLDQRLDPPAPVETIEDAADLVLWNYQQWVEAGAAIRAARLGAKAAVRTASTIEAKQAAAEVDWEAVIS